MFMSSVFWMVRKLHSTSLQLFPRPLEAKKLNCKHLQTHSAIVKCSLKERVLASSMNWRSVVLSARPCEMYFELAFLLGKHLLTELLDAVIIWMEICPPSH